jgi:rubrerythrin
MTQTLIGASVFDQHLYDHVSQHAAGEIEALKEYEALASSTESKAFAYAAGLILADERRHHQMLKELAETIRSSAELTGGPAPIPDLDLHKDREAIVELSQKLLEIEKRDRKELKDLRKELRDYKDTTLWQLVLEILDADNAKHRMILKFIRDHAKHGI